MSSLLLILEAGERRLLDQEAHYVWIDFETLRVSANPPNRAVCVGYFVSYFGEWRFCPGPAECPPELRINGRAAIDDEVELPTGRAEAQLSAEPFSLPPRREPPDRDTTRRPGPETAAPPDTAPHDSQQYVIGPSGTGAHYPIDDPSVRPNHAVFQRDARGAWWITAGTGDLLVDGELVMSAHRPPGSRFTVGRVVVTVPTDVPGRRALAVDFREVTVRRGGRRMLDRVSFTLAPGDLVAVTSPEPAIGRLVLGLIVGGYRADSGTVRVGGSSRLGAASHWVPPEDDLHGTLTVRETLRLAAAASEQADADSIDEVLAWVGLDDRPAVQVRKLDDAGRKRLAVGIELLGRPGLLVILESATAYSVGADHDLMSRLRTIGQDTNCTIVIGMRTTSHLELADTVVVIDREGQLRHAGPPGRAPAGSRMSSWAEWLAMLEAPGDRRPGAATLPAWDLDIEPESSAAAVPVALRQQALLFTRQGPGALALFGAVPVLGTGIAVLLPRPVLALAVVAVLTGLAAARLDLVTDRGALLRDRRSAGYGTLVSARLAVRGVACAVPLLPAVAFAGLAEVPMAVVPGMAPWASRWLELWLVAVIGVGIGLLGAAYGRTLRPALMAIAVLGVAGALLTAVLLSIGWGAATIGLLVLVAAVAAATATVLEQRGKR